ncbi:ral guanine nucleotide dissociation stimulator-like [Lutra lutra]|uniref:ral guanine nucleotide dissociation stimulator-like n=1 Tax=Lutra lutra TaxID=9657 RepID=UPI001FD2A3F5|nr:ral guanine nucleotide dissociation stimulator-like [Lutra lutra]
MFSCCLPASWGSGYQKPQENGLFPCCRHWLKPCPQCPPRAFRGRCHKNAPEEMVQELNVDIPCSPSSKDKKPHKANRVWRWLRGKNGSTRKRRRTSVLLANRANKLQATIDHLVPAVIRQDLRYVHIFLDTYRAFATTQEVLDLLFARFGCVYSTYDEVGGPQEQRNMAIYAILNTWVEKYPGDFVQPPESPSLHVLLAYLQVNVPGSDLERRAQLLLSEKQHAEATEPEATGEEDWGCLMWA